MPRVDLLSGAECRGGPLGCRAYGCCCASPSLNSYGARVLHCERHSNGACGWLYYEDEGCPHCLREGTSPRKRRRRRPAQSKRSIIKLQRQSAACAALVGTCLLP